MFPNKGFQVEHTPKDSPKTPKAPNFAVLRAQTHIMISGTQFKPFYTYF